LQKFWASLEELPHTPGLTFSPKAVTYNCFFPSYLGFLKFLVFPCDEGFLDTAVRLQHLYWPLIQISTIHPLFFPPHLPNTNLYYSPSFRHPICLTKHRSGAEWSCKATLIAFYLLFKSWGQHKSFWGGRAAPPCLEQHKSIL
jgi:hypothetical protein